MMQVPFSPPQITDEDILAVTNVLKSGWITTGSECKNFEQELSQWMNGYKVAVMNSATAAMEIVLRMLGVGVGDEVITSVYTYAATANVIMHVGAKPVLVDIDCDGYNLNVESVARVISERTKVIIPVDIGGYPCDYDRIFEIVEQKKSIFQGLPNSRLFKHADRIVVLADAAHSLGATYKKRFSGALADFSAFSFHAVKNLTTGEGGALSFKSLFSVGAQEIYQEAMLWSLHGQNKDALSKTKAGGWEYDIVFSGYKCNMTDMAAALGRSQLHRYKAVLARRKQLYQNYRLGLKDGITMSAWDEDAQVQSSYHLALVQVQGITAAQRNEVINQMQEQGITCNVHYKPLILLSAFNILGYESSDFANAFKQYARSISLPLFNTLTSEQQAYSLANLNEICRKIIG